MSIYSKRLTNAQKREVFSGRPVPKDWMPAGTWDQGADYIAFVSGLKHCAGKSYVFRAGPTKNTVVAHEVKP
jgi:hypothetical protein